MVEESYDLLEGIGLAEGLVEDLFAGEAGDAVGDEAGDGFAGFCDLFGCEEAGEGEVAVAGE